MHLTPSVCFPASASGRAGALLARSLPEESGAAPGLSPPRTFTPAAPAASRADAGSQPSGRSLETRSRQRSHAGPPASPAWLCSVTPAAFAQHHGGSLPGPGRPPHARAFG